MLHRSLRAVVPLSENELAGLTALVRVRRLARNEPFLRAGEHAHEIAVVVHGYLREFYLREDGSERTKAFVFAGQGTGSLADLLRGGSSSAWVVAETDTRLLCLDYAAYRALCAGVEQWGRFHLAVVEQLFLRKARREYELLALDAEARYRALLEQAPEIEQHVAAKHLASYLGITPVHLSRLRRRRACRGRPDP